MPFNPPEVVASMCDALSAVLLSVRVHSFWIRYQSMPSCAVVGQSRRSLNQWTQRTGSSITSSGEFNWSAPPALFL